MTTEADKRKVLEFLVRKVFVPQLESRVGILFLEMQNQIIKTQQVSSLFGKSVILPPITFNIVEPTEQLINNLMMVFEEKNVPRLLENK